MIIEIVGNNQTFFRRISKSNWKKMVASVPTDGWTLDHLDRLHSLVWSFSHPVKISSTGCVEASVIDDDDDISDCQLSWEEKLEDLVNECEHRHTFDRGGHLCCKDCGGVDV